MSNESNLDAGSRADGASDASEPDSASSGPASEDTGTTGGAGRWVVAVLVLVLLVYPAARWMMNRGAGAAGAPPAAGQAELQASFQHYQAQRYEEAITAAKAAIAANPNSSDAYNNMAVSYMGLRKVDEAIQAAETAIRLRPDFQLAKNNLAWFQQEKVKGTLPAIPADQATQATALTNESLEHAQAKRFKECLDTAAQATKLNPGSARAFSNAGFCAANLQLWDVAIRNTREAIRLDPALQIAKNNLAWMEQEMLKAAAANVPKSR